MWSDSRMRKYCRVATRVFGNTEELELLLLNVRDTALNLSFNFDSPRMKHCMSESRKTETPK